VRIVVDVIAPLFFHFHDFPKVVLPIEVYRSVSIISYVDDVEVCVCQMRAGARVFRLEDEVFIFW
jgi:hypothetical protein